MYARRLSAVLFVFLLIVPVASLPVAAGTADVTIRERTEMDPTYGTDDVRITYSYDVPSAVSDLRVEYHSAVLDIVSVVSTDGFDLTDSGEFVWDGTTEDPSITIEMPTGQGEMNDYGNVERDAWAFVFTPDPDVDWDAGGSDVTLEQNDTVVGEGFSNDALAYAGPHQQSTRTSRNHTVHVVTAADADPESSADAIATKLLDAVRLFDHGIESDGTVVYVLPESATAHGGGTVKQSFYVADDAVDVDEVDSLLTHEYVHTRVGVFSDKKIRWLREGSAEYFGTYLAYNTGSESFQAFHDHVTTDAYDPDSGDPVTLSKPETWRDTSADYDKGAMVLAALDARIRNETDGGHTLTDVFEYRASSQYNLLRTYDSFREAVVDVAGSEAVGRWLDRYVTTDALPTVPDNRSRFVAPGGPLDNNTTSSSVTDTPTETATATATVSTDEATAGEQTSTPDTTSPTPQTTTGSDSTRSDDGAETTPAVTDGSGPGFTVVVVAVALAFVVAVRHPSRR